jgi:hypothetical protein
MNAPVNMQSLVSPVYVDMGADLLSQQPKRVTPRSAIEAQSDFKWDVIFNHLESRLGSLRMWRYSWWSYWSSLSSQPNSSCRGDTHYGSWSRTG